MDKFELITNRFNSAIHYSIVNNIMNCDKYTYELNTLIFLKTKCVLDSIAVSI